MRNQEKLSSPLGKLVRRARKRIRLAGERAARTMRSYKPVRRLIRKSRPYVSNFRPAETIHAASFAPAGPRPLGPTSLERFDVIVSFETFEEIWDWPVESLPCKVIGFAHDTIPLRIDEGPGARPEHFYRCFAKTALRADLIVCVSASTEHDVNSFYPITVGKTLVVHNGHERARFAAPAAALRPRAGSRCRLLMLGDMDRRKNVQTVLRAMPALATKLPGTEIELLIAGKPSMRGHFSAMEQHAAKYVTVRWLGYVEDDEVPELYAGADVFLFPSLWEGFGIPVLEAMSAGVPVVCSDLSSLPEVAGRGAFFCDPYEPDSIADAIRQALAMDDRQRREWVAAAQNWAAQFTWERAGKRLAEAILRLSGEGIQETKGAAADAGWRYTAKPVVEGARG